MQTALTDIMLIKHGGKYFKKKETITTCSLRATNPEVDSG